MNLFLSLKDRGVNKALAGKVGVVYIFVSYPGQKWGTDIPKNKVRDNAKKVSAFFEKEAKKHGVSLKVSNYYLDGYSETKLTFESDNLALTKEILKGLNYQGVGNLWAYVKQLHSLDDVVVCFVLPGQDLSFAQQSRQELGEEYACIMGQAEYGSYIHEICHLYGALDYYYADSVVQKVKRYFGGSIMNSTTEIYIDDLTAYVIGWNRQLSENAKAFLAETDYLTEKEWDNQRKSRIASGKGKRVYESSVYEGDLYHGMAHGYGVLRYNNGDVYEGYFEMGKFCGQGKLVYATGDCYIGEFKNHTFHGKGVFYRKNGRKTAGIYENGKCTKRSLF